MMFHNTNTLNKFSFGPSQEDEGRKKTNRRMEGTCLTQYPLCPIHAEPTHDEGT
jgi:hypothetical protein